MIFYWVREIIQQNHFHIFWEEGEKNLASYIKNTTQYGTIEQRDQDI